MHLLPVLLGVAVAILPILGQDTWPITQTFDLTELAGQGVFTIKPQVVTIPASTLVQPTGAPDPHVAASCVALPWTISSIAAFTADPTDVVIDYSHFEFYFTDENSNLESYCYRELPHGSGESPIDREHWYNCYNYGMSFLYAGNQIGLRRKFDCNGDTVTAQGQAMLELQCRPMFNGSICQNLESIQVPIITVIH